MSKKKWSEYTLKEIKKNKKKLCVRCVYCTYTGELNVKTSNLYNVTCDYIGIEGHSRGCSPMNCKKFKEKVSGRRRRRSNFTL